MKSCIWNCSVAYRDSKGHYNVVMCDFVYSGENAFQSEYNAVFAEVANACLPPDCTMLAVAVENSDGIGRYNVYTHEFVDEV